MRKLWIAGLVVASFTGIASGQNVPEIWPKPNARQTLKPLPRPFVPQCQRMGDEKHDVNTIIEKDGVSFRCTYVYDEWLTQTNRVAWVKMTR